MRIRRGWRLPTVGALALLVVGVVSGCVPADPEPTPTPKPEPTAVFASEDEALAAAEVAYAAYLKVSDAIAQDGGADPERIREVATETWADHDIEAFKFYSEAAVRTAGDSSFSELVFQSATLDVPSVVTAYTCLNIEGTRLIDSNGADVTPGDRPSKISFEVSFESDPSRADRLLVAGSEVWSASSYC